MPLIVILKMLNMVWDMIIETLDQNMIEIIAWEGTVIGLVEAVDMTLTFQELLQTLISTFDLQLGKDFEINILKKLVINEAMEINTQGKALITVEKMIDIRMINIHQREMIVMEEKMIEMGEKMIDMGEKMIDMVEKMIGMEEKTIDMEINKKINITIRKTIDMEVGLMIITFKLGMVEIIGITVWEGTAVLDEILIQDMVKEEMQSDLHLSTQDLQMKNEKCFKRKTIQRISLEEVEEEF